MYEGCKKEKPITFHFSSAVGSVESFTLKSVFKVKPRHGEAYTVTTDVLLASDGVKSIIRPQILDIFKHDAQIVDTNQAAYRIMLKREEMENDQSFWRSSTAMQ